MQRELPRLLPFLARTGLLQPLLGKRRRASSTASFQCQEAHDNFYHSLASDPLPIVGNAVMRRRAAPMGMSVIVSSGSGERTGLG